FWKGDALEYLARYGQEFDAIHASPPCQAHTAGRMIWNTRLAPDRHPDFIPATRTLLRQTGRPYVIENVPRAPLIDPIVVCGLALDLGVKRHRLFETSFPA